MSFKFKKANKIITVILLLTIIWVMGCKKNACCNTIVPESPTNLTAIVVSTTKVNLEWTDNSTNETGYKIQRKTNTGNFTDIGMTAKDISIYTDQGLTPNTTYTYRVYAYNSAGPSISYSNEVTVLTALLANLTTTAISDTTASTAVSGGNITTDAGSTITARGVVWSTQSNPTIALSTKTVDGTGTGSFSSNITGLSANTLYYVRAYATNANGTAYGNEINFSTQNIDLTKGLVAWYPFTGNAIDSSGNGNNGMVYGATLTTDRFGNQNSAYYFVNDLDNGVLGDEIYIPYNSSFNVNNLSVSIWINPVSYSFGSCNLINRFEDGYSNPNGQSWVMQLTPNYAYAQVLAASSSNNQTSDISISNSPIPLSTWTNLIFTFNGDSLKFYVNGVLNSTVPVNSAINTNSNSGISIGQSRQANGNWFDYNGSIDDIYIYNRELTQLEITYLANH